VTIKPWQPGDIELLRALNTPDMTRFLGGPETDEQVRARHERYLSADGLTVAMFRVVVAGEPAPVGSVGFWERPWHDGTAYEVGWGIVPAHQRRGLGTVAVGRLAAFLRERGRHRWLHAFPAVVNEPSNGTARKAGFELMGQVDFEYPPGHQLRCNDWRLDVGAPPDPDDPDDPA
jgi:RimJ/RimL family protein N-acetyltransferase